MKYCANCGKEIDENAFACPHCGVAVSSNSSAVSATEDTGNWGWGVLGCCIPIVGLILYLVWKDSKPLSSKRAGIGALIGVAAYILFYVLMFLFVFLIGGIAAANGY